MSDPNQFLVVIRVQYGAIFGPYTKDASLLCHENVAGDAIPNISRFRRGHELSITNLGENCRVGFHLMLRKLANLMQWKTIKPGLTCFRTRMCLQWAFPTVNPGKKVCEVKTSQPIYD